MYAPPTVGAARALRAGPARVRARIEDSVERYGLAYPWWVPVISMAGQLACVIVALGLRDALWSPDPLALTLVLVAVPGIVHVGFQVWTPWWVETVVVLGAGAWLLANPVSGTGTIDTAPALLALFTAEMVGREGVGVGAIVGVLSLATIAGFADNTGLVGGPVHLLDVLLGFAIGCIVRAQMRALAAERAARAGERQRATLAERERIAREIHDLVAHSLSVTLLQITGARHALRDAEGPDAEGLDVAEVDAALADAERVGRQAMADIRRTVSTLTDGPADARALPGAADIGGLVEQMELAGLAVEYAEDGDPGMLAHGTGLGLYRIAQESLANIAKHAPTATARVWFSVSPTQARLIVRNALPAVGPRIDGSGSGLAGMRARAAQLGGTLVAGPEHDQWLVDLCLRLEQRDGELWCGRKLPRLLR
jgi:signal transduction histidine kinase